MTEQIKTPQLPPFACAFTPGMPALLWEMGISLAISTYQAGKVIVMSASSPERMVQLARNFDSAMGLALSGRKLAVATEETVEVLSNSPELAPTFPGHPQTYDSLYIPRASYYTGPMNVHDMAYGQHGLWAVNTRLSCLCLIDDEFNFQPIWKPLFISDLDPNDRCHLNGMAMANGGPAYATAFCVSDKKGGWRDYNTTKVGILMEVPSGKMILQGLCRPHSPRVYEGQLYVCNSGAGEVLHVDPRTSQTRVIAQLPGWTRGMAAHSGILFVGLSKMREGRGEGPRDLPLLQQGVETQSGVAAIELRSGKVLGTLFYQNSVEQVYDLAVLSSRRPNILNLQSKERGLALHTPEETFWGRMEKKEKKEKGQEASKNEAEPAGQKQS